MEGEHIQDYFYKFRCPCLITLSGSTSSGKSTTIKDILSRSDEIFDKTIDHVIYCYSISQPVLFNDIKKLHNNIEFNKGLPYFSNDEQVNKLYIIDDLVHESGKSQGMHDAFIRGSHHLGINIIFVTQNFFDKNIRPLTLQSHYLILKNNPRDKKFIQHLSRQMSAGKRYIPLEKAYEDCCKQPFSHVIIDLTQAQNGCARVRLHTFPEESVYYVESDK